MNTFRNYIMNTDEFLLNIRLDYREGNVSPIRRWQNYNLTPGRMTM